MTVEVSNERARLLRLRAQGLSADRDVEATVASIVRDCCGLQAQDARQAPLSVRARGRGLTADDVERARIQDRSIARSWCMRGTIHYVAMADLPWLLSLFGPLYADRGERRLGQLGFDAHDADRAVSIVRDALADEGPLTRDELADRLLDEGFAFDPDGQAPFHLVRRACLEGVAVEAAPRDGSETYTLVDDWEPLEPAPEREAALAELARRYVAAHEPATPEGLHAWSGLYKRDVRIGWDAIGGELTAVSVAGDRAWTLSSPDTVNPGVGPIVRLLPMYDSYFLGHADRDLVLPAEHADRVHPGGGLIRATVVVDGSAVATWKLDRSLATPRVLVEPFEGLDPAVEPGLETEVEDLGRFLDTEIEYRIG